MGCGCARDRRRAEQIDVVEAATRGSGCIVVRNARVDMYKNFMRLAVDKWGKITAFPDGIESTPDGPSVCAAEPNLSTVEFECVTDGAQEGGLDEGFDPDDPAMDLQDMALQS